MRNLFIICFLLFYASAAMAAERDLVILHRNPANLNNKDCLACHANITKEVSLNPKYKTFHRVHLESKLGTPKNCTDCHQVIDLRQGSGASLRKQVDPQLCDGCHNGGLKGAKRLFAQ